MLLPDRPPGLPPRLLLPALAFANFAIGIGAFVVIGILSPIAAGLGMSHREAGLVMSLYALAYTIASPLAVATTGRLPRRKVVMLGMGIFFAAAILSALAPTPEILFIARAFSAVGAGMVTPVAAGIAVAVSPPERRGAALALVFLGLTLAQVAGIPLGSFIGYTAGWRATFWMVAAFAALGLLAVARFVPGDIRTPVTSLASLGRTLRSPALMVAILITASMMASAYIVFTYFGPLVEERMGYGRNGVTLVLILYGAGAVAGNALGGFLADRIGAVRALLLVTAAQAVVLPFFSFLPLPDYAAAALAVIWGAVGWSFMVPQQSRLVAIAPESQNVSLALNASAIYLGAAIGSAAGGVILDRAGLDALGISAALVALAVLCHILLSIRLTNRASRITAGSG